MAQKKQSTVQVAEEIIRPVLEELGLKLWDTRFEKEGSSWFLRYFIDKDGGVNINDCERASKLVDKLLDEVDPIDQSYTLEVSSPGIERQLVKDWHFGEYIGHQVAVRLIRPVDGVRDFVGELAAKEGEMIRILLDDDVEMEFAKKEAAFVRLHVDF